MSSKNINCFRCYCNYWIYGVRFSCRYEVHADYLFNYCWHWFWICFRCTINCINIKCCRDAKRVSTWNVISCKTNWYNDFTTLFGAFIQRGFNQMRDIIPIKLEAHGVNPEDVSEKEIEALVNTNYSDLQAKIEQLPKGSTRTAIEEAFS